MTYSYEYTTTEKYDRYDDGKVITFIGDSDLSGEITIAKRDKNLSRDLSWRTIQAANEEFTVPGEALISYVLDHLRKRAIGELEELNDEELLTYFTKGKV